MNLSAENKLDNIISLETHLERPGVYGKHFHGLSAKNDQGEYQEFFDSRTREPKVRICSGVRREMRAAGVPRSYLLMRCFSGRGVGRVLSSVRECMKPFRILRKVMVSSVKKALERVVMINALLLLILLIFSFSACGPVNMKPSPQTLKLVEQGAEWLKSGDLNRAEASYSLALEYRPNMAEAYNGLALVALERGDRELAVKHLRKALTFNEDLAEAHNNLGVLYYRAGKMKKSRTHLISALGVDPGYHTARGNLVRTLLKMGKHKEARTHLLKITAQKPDDAGVWAQLALVCVTLNRSAEAGRAVDIALKLNPKFAAGHRAKGRLLYLKGHYFEAASSFREALQFDVSDWRSRHYLGLSFLMLQRNKEALKHLMRAAAGRPSQGDVQFALSFALIRAERYHEALKRLEADISSRPGKHKELYLLAVCYKSLGRNRDARRVLKSLNVKNVPGKLRQLAASKLKEWSGVAPGFNDASMQNSRKIEGEFAL